MSEVLVRIVRSDGKELLLNDGRWRLPKDGLSGFATLDYSVSSAEIPSHDGSIITSKRVNSKDRSIKAVAAHWQDNEELRSEAISFFNPKYTFECHLTYMGRTRWCSGEQIGFSCSEGNIYEPAVLNWTILCANPYLQSEGNFGKDIAEIVPKFGFPFMSFLPVSKGSVPGCNTGFVMSLHAFAQSVSLSNDGDVDAGMKTVITAHGNVKNPMLRIGNGFVRIKTTMHEGDVIVLDASQRPPLVRLNGENIMHLVDRNSTILNMVISVGDTEVEYDADDGYQNMSVVVSFNKQYLGI